MVTKIYFSNTKWMQSTCCCVLCIPALVENYSLLVIFVLSFQAVSFRKHLLPLRGCRTIGSEGLVGKPPIPYWGVLLCYRFLSSKSPENTETIWTTWTCVNRLKHTLWIGRYDRTGIRFSKTKLSNDIFNRIELHYVTFYVLAHHEICFHSFSEGPNLSRSDRRSLHYQGHGKNSAPDENSRKFKTFLQRQNNRNWSATVKYLLLDFIQKMRSFKFQYYLLSTVVQVSILYPHRSQ